jgi:hypothetical protein
MGFREALRRLVADALPWYDVEAQERVDRRSEQLEERLTNVMPAIEQIRRDYGAMADRLERRRVRR